jgi:hypothetical protein
LQCLTVTPNEAPSRLPETFPQYFEPLLSYSPPTPHCLNLTTAVGDQRSSFDEPDSWEISAVSTGDIDLDTDLVGTVPMNSLPASVLDDTRVPYSHYQPYTATRNPSASIRFQFRVREGTPLEHVADQDPDGHLYVPSSRDEEARSEQGSYQPMSVSSASTSSELSVASSSVPAALYCSEEGCDAVFSGAYRRGNLARHKRSIHRGLPGTYLCEVLGCHRSFNRSDARLKHYRKHHPELSPRPIELRPQRRSHR